MATTGLTKMFGGLLVVTELLASVVLVAFLYTGGLRIDDLGSDVHAAAVGDNTMNVPDNTLENVSWWEYPPLIREIGVENVSHKVVVDKRNKLPSNYIPEDLLIIRSIKGLRVRQGAMIRSIVLEDLENLARVAKKDGVDLYIRSAYRSYESQVATYNYWLTYFGGDSVATDKISARPGHSEHQLGTTIDFSTSEIGDMLTQEFAKTEAYKWLSENADEYGFKLSYPEGEEYRTGYSFEPWHWRWWGR